LEEKLANLEAKRVEPLLSLYSTPATWPQNSDLITTSSEIKQEGDITKNSVDNKEEQVESYEVRRNHLEHDVDRLWDDTDDEFHSIMEVANFFRDWRQNHLESYKVAYVSLSLPTLFTPLIKYDLLKWRPLLDESQPKSIMELDCFKYLKNFAASSVTNASMIVGFLVTNKKSLFCFIITNTIRFYRGPS
jgi:hypothetical protein